MKVYVSSTSLPASSMVEVCMSSMLYVLLCVIKSVVAQKLKESECVVFDFLLHLHKNNVASIV